jgi:tetrahydromethanopterin S-methyltransferase subunit G
MTQGFNKVTVTLSDIQLSKLDIWIEESYKRSGTKMTRDQALLWCLNLFMIKPRYFEPKIPSLKYYL